MRQMDDDLIARFLLIWSGIVSLLLCLAHYVQTSGQYRVSKFHHSYRMMKLATVPNNKMIWATGIKIL